MNPLLSAALGSVIRWALAMAVPFFVSNGIWTPDESTAYVAGATAAILALGWSLFQKYGARVDFLNALWASPSTPEDIVKEQPAPSMRNLMGLLLVLSLAGSVACAKAAQVSVAADDIAFQRIESLKLTKDAYCDAGKIPSSGCVSLAKAFVPLWDGYLAVNRALASGTPLEKIDPTVAALQEAGRGFAAEVNRLQDGEGKRILLDLLGAVLARF